MSITLKEKKHEKYTQALLLVSFFVLLFVDLNSELYIWNMSMCQRVVRQDPTLRKLLVLHYSVRVELQLLWVQHQGLCCLTRYSNSTVNPHSISKSASEWLCWMPKTNIVTVLSNKKECSEEIWSWNSNLSFTWSCCNPAPPPQCSFQYHGRLPSLWPELWCPDRGPAEEERNWSVREHYL